jgi:hypothetical protein
MSAETLLTQMAERLREAPAEAIERAMPKLQRATREYLEQCYARGVDPDGKPWPLTAAGAVPRFTGSDVEVVWQDERIIVRAKGHAALHTLGLAKAREKVVRPLIPMSEEIPPALLERFEAILLAELKAGLQP